MEKLFTVENIAEMTGLTSRTIRNYIADGRLKGRKIGSQWRFTEADIEALMSAPSVSRETVETKAGIVSDFLRPQQRDGVTICSVIDYPSASPEAPAAISEMICDAINTYSDDAGVEFSYQFVESAGIGRFILTGPIEPVSKLVKLIRKKG